MIDNSCSGAYEDRQRLIRNRPEMFADTNRRIVNKDLNCVTMAILWFLVGNANCHWWYLGVSNSTYRSMLNNNVKQPQQLDLHQNRCLQIQVLNSNQKETCSRAASVLDVISNGASTAIEECKQQFQFYRWNCPTFDELSVFGNILNGMGREKAFIYAITSAGVMHAVTQACAKGEVRFCSCDFSVKSQQLVDNFLWGGCSHDVKFGEKFARDFVREENSNQNKEMKLMNAWNTESGLKTVSSNMKVICKCHGVSGSCSAKICWRLMPSFRDVGDELKDKFDGASQVRFNVRLGRLKQLDRLQKRPTRRDLVYIGRSPDFCEYNPSVGSLGTVGRECNRTSYGLDGCPLMCCGRGYRTLIEEVAEDCNCRFFWCCEVECDVCVKQVSKFYCN